VIFGGPSSEEIEKRIASSSVPEGHVNPLGPGDHDKSHKPQPSSVDDDEDSTPAVETKKPKPPAQVPTTQHPRAKPDHPAEKPKHDPATDHPHKPDAAKPASKPAVKADGDKMASADKPGNMSNPRREPKPSAPDREPDAAEAAAFTKAIQRVRGALAGRNMQQAEDDLKAAQSLAFSAAQKGELGRVEALTDYVVGFWKAVSESLKTLNVTDELKIGGTSVAVVDADANSLTIHKPGKNASYTLANMPAGIAFMLAERWYDKRPANKIYLGAFQLVDPSGDVAEARRLWEEATKSGASADIVMPLLDGPKAKPLGMAADDTPEKPEKGDKGALVQAERAFMQKYGPEMRAAGTPEKRLELADKLLEEIKLSTDPGEQNMIFRKTCELVSKVAVGAGTSGDVAHEAAVKALKLIEQAISEKRADSAKPLAQAAITAARKSKDDALVKEATEHAKKLQEAMRDAG
jgi:hypothetical protein